MRARELNRWCARCRALSSCWVVGLLCATAHAQIGLTDVTSRYDLAGEVQVEEAGRTVLTYLNRVDQYLIDGKWSEAVDSIRQVMDESGDKLLPVSPNRYVPTRTICHLKLVDFPVEALQLYRDLVDPIAAEWFRAWEQEHDRVALERVVDEAFASSWGDDALAALGEVLFQEGQYSAARAYWQRILPFSPPKGSKRTWLSFPDSDKNLAEVRARLIMLSVFEGRVDEAESYLDQFNRTHPGARGRLGGRDVLLGNALKELMRESRSWPDLPEGEDWLTFAGSPMRHRVSPKPFAVGDVVWHQAIRPPGEPTSSLSASRDPAVAEDSPSRLSFYPVLAKNRLFLNNQIEILGFDVVTGKPAWESETAAVFRDPLHGTLKGGVLASGGLGTARHTMTIADQRLYARMGSGVTTLSQQPERARATNYLICLDLQSQGRLLWKAVPEDGWAYEGAPLVRGDDVYVTMRRSDIRPQAYVACLDARTGTRRWLQFICSAETPARGIFPELTNGLLTLVGDTLFLNTNLGAVAAIAAMNGRIRWLTTYPRALKGSLIKPADHWARDLTPCLADRGTLYVAPADTPYVFALGADNGQVLWQSSAELADVVHLLGVSNDCLIASGHKLYWISGHGGDAGRVTSHWPEGHEQIGFGRGLLTRKHVWWPTRSKVFVFESQSARLVRQIDLEARGASGGHLLVASGGLVITGSDRVTALAAESRRGPPEDSLVQRTP